MARLDHNGEATQVQRISRRDARTPATFWVAESDIFLSTLDQITQAGWAIRFGRTRDGGALAIGVYGDGPTPYTDYLPPGANLLEYIRDLAVRAETSLGAYERGK